MSGYNNWQFLHYLMGILLYFIKETFRGFFQAKLMTFVSIIIVSVTLFFLSMIILGFLNIDRWLSRAAEQTGVNVFLTDDFSICEDSVISLKGYIKELPFVKDVVYINKDAAWKQFEKEHGSEMLASIDDNPLPASLEVTLEESGKLGDYAEKLKNEVQFHRGVDAIQYSSEWIERLGQFQKYFNFGAFIMALVMLFALHYIIANTIRLTIYARKDLVTNMRFVGATDLYIKVPFVLEGILQGVVGAFISIICLGVLRILLFRFQLYWGELYFYPVILAIGALFGWIGSSDAVRKFLF